MITIEKKNGGSSYIPSCACGWKGDETWYGAAQKKEIEHLEDCDF